MYNSAGLTFAVVYTTYLPLTYCILHIKYSDVAHHPRTIPYYTTLCVYKLMIILPRTLAVLHSS
ncbi:hypothetical protein GGR58DRAFT_461866 [Xylaria digitata]|nr:hypothetical protein GGR58DRAFT_461866 [Xylaria digitata]